MILELLPKEKNICTGGDSCECVCWKEKDKKSGTEVPFGETTGIEVVIGFLKIALGGAATKCRAECNLHGHKFRRCED